MNHPAFKQENKKLMEHIYAGFSGPRYENKEDYLAFFRTRCRNNGEQLKRYYDTNRYSLNILEKYKDFLVTYYQLVDPSHGMINNFIYQLNENFHAIAVPVFNSEVGKFFVLFDISFVNPEQLREFITSNEKFLAEDEKKIGF